MVSQIYHTSTVTKSSAGFQSIPYSNASITFNSNKASTASFNSIKKLNEGDKIRIIGDNHREFGGQIIKQGAKLGDGAYSYECIDYTRLFFGETVANYNKYTSYEIIKALLNTIGYSTAGLKPTTKRHGSLKWKAVSRWDIIQELRGYDYRSGQLIECYVNPDGTLVYQPMPQTHEGYIFKSAYDYNQDYDAGNIITGASTIYDDNKGNISFLASSQDKNMMAVWGRIMDIEEGC